MITPMNKEGQQFLNNLDKQLWDAADCLEAEVCKNLGGAGL